MLELASERIAVPDDLESFNQLAEDRGWSDGLPLVPPTEARVQAMLRGLDPARSLGPMPPSMGEATLEKLAVNAVMVGARPEWFRVIVTAAEAVLEPVFNLYAVQATTSPATPMLVVNGPLARQLGYNAAGNCLGPGWPANATTGRALRLALQNIGGGAPHDLAKARPGLAAFDYATHGFPGKFTMCAAENEAESPWEPLHVERGLKREESAVTALAVDSTWELRDNASGTGADLLLCLASTMASFGTANLQFGGQPAVAFGPELAAVVARDGFSKQEVKRFLFQHARLDLTRLPLGQAERHKIARQSWTEVTAMPVCDSPEDIVVLVLGGAGVHEIFLPTFGSSRAVTQRIES